MFCLFNKINNQCLTLSLNNIFSLSLHVFFSTVAEYWIKKPINICRTRTGFDKGSLERLELLFRKTVGNEKEIRREDFKKIVTSKNVRFFVLCISLTFDISCNFINLNCHSFQPFFTERVFQIFDKDNSGSISLQEFIDAIHQFAGQSPEDKIKFLFKVYDLDGDGLIQHKELQHVMRACMEENGMQFSEDQVSFF